MSPLPFSRPFRSVPSALLAIGLGLLPSCVKEDEELQSQLIEARATLIAKTKALDEASSQVSSLQQKLEAASKSSSTTLPSAPAPAPSPSPSNSELAKLKARISELEGQVTAARQASSSGSETTTKIDMDAMANRLEEDLTRKAKQLRELVQKQTRTGKIDEIGLKAIDYPPQIVTPFTSAITFSIVAENGQRLRLTFPVTADLGGTWKLPDPSAVRVAFEQAQSTPQAPLVAEGGNSGSTPAAPPASPPTVASSPAPAPQSQQQHQGGASGMRQVAPGVFEFNWGDGSSPTASAPPQRPAPAPAPTPAPQPQSPPVASNTPISNFTPPGPGGTAPAPAPGGAPAPQAPAPGPAAVPAPVMPVQQDITIRFD